MKLISSSVSLLLLFSVVFAGPKAPKPIPPVAQGADGKLVYAPDSKGNRIPDFSYAGYMAAEKTIPNVAVKVVVPVAVGDATLRIQSAIDYLASLPADKDGFRGAILLEKGTYEVEGTLKLNASGVVLRGSGAGEGGTTIVGKGFDRETLIRIVGKNDRKLLPSLKISDAYVPVNAMAFSVENASTLKVGDRIVVQRPCTDTWIKTLGTEHFGGGITSLGWKPGDRDLEWDRTITAIEGNKISIDAPITTAIDTAFGGGTISKYTWNGRISQIGVENVRLISEFNASNLKDEAHRWIAIAMDNVQDAWVRQVNFEHFASSAVAVWGTARRVTIEDCKSLAPVSEIGGQRRYTIRVSGEQVLVLRVFSEYGYHDFCTGLGASLVAFVQCEAVWAYNFSGGIDSWSSGVLFDIVNVDGNAISYKDLGQDKQGAGWNAANSMLWQCAAPLVECYAPPTAQNWAFGIWAQFKGDGSWWDSNNHIQPRSFYYEQLAERTGFKPIAGTNYMDVSTDASSSPSVEDAQEMVVFAHQPKLQLWQFIDMASKRNPIPIDSKGVKTIDQIGLKAKVNPSKLADLKIENGWIVRSSSVVTGNLLRSGWWKGSVRQNYLERDAEPTVTRYVPGRYGNGLTDDIDALTDSMKRQNYVTLDHNYGLWYERRRDDHERIRRMDGDVWVPFFEQPFARSGKELAWDGLSKYDLTQYNKWYWMRLKQYADEADQKGLVLYHQNYFQHNIIEAGAHWVDCPWRSANNINNTGFLEPVPFVGDKRVFVADQFYDITNPVRVPLHKAYIRQCMNNFKDNGSVIQFLSFEFTGPFHFVKFWLQTIKEWEAERGKHVLIALSATKDVQDSILADKEVSDVVNVIDIRYWSYRDDGSLFAPKGGLNLAPRQHMRLIKTGKRSFDAIYNEIRDYRSRFPEKAVVYTNDSYDAWGWAIFMAGGSLANIPQVTDKQFNIDASAMKVIDLPEKTAGVYALANPGKAYIVYSEKSGNVKIDLSSASGTFKVRYINAKTGEVSKETSTLKGGSVVDVKGTNGFNVCWISKS